jgi:hypothetical protein
MDEQGKVIDGTARARQWRRSRPKSAADTDGAEAHSDAPKSIASSLLVPAEMLDGAPAPQPGEIASPTNGAGAGTVIADGGSSSARDFTVGAEDQNLFLAPDAAVVVESRQRPKRHDGRVIGPAVAAVARLLASFRIGALTRPAHVGAALALVALVIVAVELGSQSHTTSPTIARASGRTAALAGLVQLKTASLSAVARAFAATQTATRQRADHVARAHRSRQHHPANRASHGTPGQSGSSGSNGSAARAGPTASSAISNASSSTGYTPSGGSSAPSTGGSSSSSGSSSGSAFGQGGTLGPGHSPSS